MMGPVGTQLPTTATTTAAPVPSPVPAPNNVASDPSGSKENNKSRAGLIAMIVIFTIAGFVLLVVLGVVIYKKVIVPRREDHRRNYIEKRFGNLEMDGRSNT
jgi:heme/copper-type cytochrome/quinol oxidase subunit 2